MKQFPASAFPLLILVLASFVFPQEPTDFSGVWHGIMVQPAGPMGTDGYYHLRFDLTQDSTIVSGISRIEVPGTLYFGEMTLTGESGVSELTFVETEITSQRPRYTWCLKQGRLAYDADLETLAGRWEAAGCSPGAILLYRLR